MPKRGIAGRRARRYAYAAVATVVTVGFAYYAVHGVRFDEVRAALRETRPLYLAPALGSFALAVIIRVVRWRALFSPGTRPGFRPATEALVIGQLVNSVLPFRAGEAASIFALHSLAGSSRVETTGTVVLARLFDVLSLLLLLFLMLPWLPEVTWIRAAGTLAVALVLAAAAAAVVLQIYGEGAIRFALRPLARLPFLSPRRVETAVRNLTAGVIGLRSVRVAAVAFLWTTLSWLALAASFWFVLLGFGLGLSPFAGLLVVITTTLSLLLPAAPASIGVFEAAAIVGLVPYGVSRAEGLSAALVIHALTVLPFVAGGLWVLGARRGLLRRDDRAARARPPCG